MGSDKIINVIEELLHLVRCTAPADSAVISAINEGERVAATLKDAAIVDIVTAGEAGHNE